MKTQTMKRKCNNCRKEIETENESTYCAECADEFNRYREECLEKWKEEMNSLYRYDEGGFCDGFTKY